MEELSCVPGWSGSRPTDCVSANHGTLPCHTAEESEPAAEQRYSGIVGLRYLGPCLAGLSFAGLIRYPLKFSVARGGSVLLIRLTRAVVPLRSFPLQARKRR